MSRNSTTSLATIVSLAEWAAFHCCQEVFDACGEIFEKQSFVVDSKSRLGIRLTFFACTRSLNSIHDTYSEAVLSELLDYIKELVCIRLFLCTSHVNSTAYQNQLLDYDYRDVLFEIEHDILFQVSCVQL